MHLNTPYNEIAGIWLQNAGRRVFGLCDNEHKRRSIKKMARMTTPLAARKRRIRPNRRLCAPTHGWTGRRALSWPGITPFPADPAQLLYEETTMKYALLLAAAAALSLSACEKTVNNPPPKVDEPAAVAVPVPVPVPGPQGEPGPSGAKGEPGPEGAPGKPADAPPPPPPEQR
jgi:hypothetical protein